jgi:hypothetical protein
MVSVTQNIPKATNNFQKIILKVYSVRESFVLAAQRKSSLIKKNRGILRKILKPQAVLIQT